MLSSSTYELDELLCRLFLDLDWKNTDVLAAATENNSKQEHEQVSL